MFMRVNAKCAHHLRPPPPGAADGLGDIYPDKLSALRTTVTSRRAALASPESQLDRTTRSVLADSRASYVGSRNGGHTFYA
jgi:hypothetical protein